MFINYRLKELCLQTGITGKYFLQVISINIGNAFKAFIVFIFYTAKVNIIKVKAVKPYMDIVDIVHSEVRG